MLTPRLIQILTILLKSRTVISVKQLAEQVGVSKRTVQRELESIDRSLKSYDVTFESRTGVGVWIEGSVEAKRALLEEISANDNYDMTNREERRRRLTLEILKDKELKKLFVYSSKFKVSEATISGDLEVIELWLSEYGLHIVRKPGSGVYVEGAEKNYRKAIRAFIEENMNTKAIQEAYETSFEMSSAYESIKKSGISQMLDEKTIQRVVDCIMELNNPHLATLTESSYLGLVLHISIAINRIIQKETIEEDYEWLEKFDEEDPDYQLAEDIVWSLEEAFDLEIAEMEISYICLHIKGAKHERIELDGKKFLKLENHELKQLLNDMIYEFDSDMAYLLKRDEEFIQGLLAHLQPTLIRLRYELKIQNPILDGVKRDYPEIYEKCTKAAKVMEVWVGSPIPDTEIGFLTVHFGAALVRAEGRKESLRPVRVAVVCSSGIGISRLMSTKLEKIFQERMIIQTYGKRDMTAYEEQKYDFCISSIAIEMMEIPVIEVNPLLNEEDIEAIRRYVNKYERTPEKQKEKLEFSDQMEQVHILATQINRVIKGMQVNLVANDISFDALLDDIATKLNPFGNNQNQIKESLLERERISTQVYAEFDFALLHARTKGVINPSFNIWMTRDLGSYQASEFKKIKIAFVMLVPMDENLKINSEIMGHISTLLVEDDSFIEVVETGNQETIRHHLSLLLKKFFATYLSRFTES